jgi:hypothetical protein
MDLRRDDGGPATGGAVRTAPVDQQSFSFEPVAITNAST